MIDLNVGILVKYIWWPFQMFLALGKVSETSRSFIETTENAQKQQISKNNDIVSLFSYWCDRRGVVIKVNRHGGLVS